MFSQRDFAAFLIRRKPSSRGGLTTGVTVRPWTGMLMLRKCSSPETYFQSAFRVQSPWTVADEAGNEIVVKPECYVFDFAPNRALMNDAVWKFRRYEDSSLRYMGVSRHRGLDAGLWDTVLTEEDFKAAFEGLVEE